MSDNDIPPYMRSSIIDSSNFHYFANGEPCVLGIDEAGRGPVLGPMVYACAISPVDKSEQLGATGVNDSKKLSEKRRNACFEKIDEHRYQEVVAYAYSVLSARFISAHQLSTRCPKTLNEISHESAISLIENALKANINVQQVYVDTVGPKATYQELLQKQFPNLSIIVSEKADAIFPIVGAASVIAKVKRDESLRTHVNDERTLRPPAAGYGSGYPADPATQQYMCDNIDHAFGYTTLVRFSWKTTIHALEVGTIKCKKIDPEPKATLFSHFRRTNDDSYLDKSTFYKKRKISNVVDF